MSESSGKVGGMNEDEPVTVKGHVYPSQAAADKDSKNVRRMYGCLIVLAVFVVLVFAGCSALMNSSKNDGGGNTDRLAKSVCHASVEKQLKNPGSAQYSDESISSGIVTGIVEAKNALGGSVSYDYTCTTSGLGSDVATGTARLTQR